MSTTSSIKKQPLIQVNQSRPHAKDDPCKYILHKLLKPYFSIQILLKSTLAAPIAFRLHQAFLHHHHNHFPDLIVPEEGANYQRSNDAKRLTSTKLKQSKIEANKSVGAELIEILILIIDYRAHPPISSLSK
ncbi:hypothetical protein PPACK8108_LOCUS20043 [Phakopsora pachyrhizi]|uniref:Uncharacterized protein n=1 Tax=Phakopsora pachyrhizi TaxID=170000 RepID=A0AAV0BG57_PHAPC|nr:hypothetical protein PPACK8108_LOCUS20043 [Phakopsora pachyrhizi]